MPTYDYRCKACGHEFELAQSMTAPVKRKCPACATLQLERLVGVGAGFIIKGGAASAKAEAAEKAKDKKDRKAAVEASTKDTESKKPTEKATTETTPKEKPKPEKKPEPEKKLSGSTSTPTHAAREGRGVGNLVDKAKRRAKEVSKKKVAPKRRSADRKRP
ncbi:MAG: zinc ribbon domain-containing protein [Phycisphaerales bacterium]|jgi:putative FmdB family regulatory protein|nr:zinc ribbon domain-containing protein [Phycisphaerales bacterium]